MKKRLFILFFMISAVSAFSQITVEPSHSFYSNAQNWYLNGLIDHLPPTRPYTTAVIKDILSAVIEKGSQRDKAIAGDYWEELTGKSWYASFGAEFTLKNSEIEDRNSNNTTDINKLLGLYPSVQGDFSFKDDFVSIGYKLGFAGRNSKNEEDFIPKYAFSQHDAVQDPASVGPMKLYLDCDSVVSVGTKNLFLQSGIFRNGYGYFLGEGLALNDDSYHRGNFVLTYMGEKLSYTQQISAIGASSSYDGASLYPNKFLAFHSVEYRLLPSFSVAYYESMIYGNRFDPSYIIPVPYMVAQGIGGNSDNLQMGLMFNLRPARGFLWSTDIYVDDFDVNELVKLNLDSKYRFALQTGIVYTPEDSYCTRFHLNTMLVTPYTYSHWSYSDNVYAKIDSESANYQNYTNSGIHIGTNYEPNSAAVSMGIEFNPIRHLTFTIDSNLVIHSNVAEGLSTSEALTYLKAEPGVYATDGSIYEHAVFEAKNEDGTYGTTGKHVESAWNALNFLTQDHQMYTIQATLGGKYVFPSTKSGLQFAVKLGYTFEYIHNDGVDRELFPGLGKNLTSATDENGTVTYTYQGNDYSGEELVDYFKKNWENQLTDRLNNYVTVGFNLRF